MKKKATSSKRISTGSESETEIIRALRREIEVEAALERVRSAAMSMHSSNDLSHTIKVLFDQLKELGIDMVNTYLVLYDLPNNQFSFRMTGKNGKELSEMLTFSFDKLPGFKPALKAWKSRKPVIEAEYLGNNRKKWLDLIKPMNSKLPKASRLKLSDFPNGVYSCSGRHDFGSLGIIKNKSANEEEKQLLLRFAKEFNQTYTRYLDLSKAEAQAREAQIEAALERVRAASMAMHKSDELLEVVRTLDKEMLGLGIDINGTQILTDFASEGVVSWYAREGQAYLEKIYVPYVKRPLLSKLQQAWKKNLEYFTERYSRAEKNQFLRWLYKHTKYGNFTTKERRKFVFSTPGWSRVTVLSENSALVFQHFELRDYTKEEVDIFKRFGKVFEQSYTRFIDLKRAEAQAREAQIEVALERIRARSMAMHKSSELWDVINVVFKEFVKLDISIDSCWINLYKAHDNGLNTYVAAGGHQMYPGLIHQPYHDHPLFNIHNAGKKNHGTVISKRFDKEVAGKYWRYLFSKVTDIIVSKKRQKFLLSKPLTSAFTFGRYSSMNFNRYDLTDFTEEDKKVMLRFCLTFDQTYMRFLDLQKAEVQARESRIEAALEKVRSRSLALQKSDELREVVAVLLQQLQIIGINAYMSMIVLLNRKTEEYDVMMSSDVQSVLPEIYRVPNFRSTFRKRFIKSFSERKPYMVFEFGGKLKKDFDKLFFEVTDFARLPAKSKKMMQSLERCSLSCAYMSHGCIEAIGDKPLSDEDANTLQRFARVFEQAYTRFLDIKNAEAQAREAQIEAALERVRSKALAMHTSSDLSSAASVVFSELRKLGFQPFRSGISLNNRENRINTLYTATRSKKGDELSLVGTAILDNHPILSTIYDKWLIGEDYYPSMKGKLLKSYYKEIAPNFTVPKEQAELEHHGYFVSFSKGLLYGWATNPVEEDQKIILKRFASVVDLTFKRYFDLQKAEEQAREAQIEAALERVRGKAMGMHNSSDLPSTASVVFTELRALGLNPFRSGISLNSKGNLEAQIYLATETKTGDELSLVGTLMLDIHPVLQQVYDQWSIGEDYYPSLKGKSLRSFYKAITPNFKVPKEQSEIEQYGYFVPFTQGWLYGWTTRPVDESQKQILKRFASVVDLTFKRYLDLQKAEEQAREAHIETALEKVRSAATAMQKHSDMVDVCKIISEQLIALGVARIRNVQTTEYNLKKETYTGYEYWASSGTSSIVEQPMKGHPTIEKWVKEITRSKDSHFQKSITGKELHKWRKYLVSLGQRVDPLTQKTKSLDYYFYSIRGGAIGISTYAPLSNQEIILFKRFSNVFDLAYHRYLDIRKAEAQAREAQIELALERVRARTMAMHHSDELSETAAVLFQQFNELGNKPERLNIGIVKKDEGVIEFWSTEQGGKQIDHVFKASIKEPTSMSKVYKAWKKGLKSLVIDLSGKELKQWINYMKNEIKMPVDDSLLRERRVHSVAFFSQGMILLTTPEPLQHETVELLKRFASVFEQTYTRFLDLKNAEKQAREAEIQLALERVRAKTMAMKSSDDLGDTSFLLANQVRELGIKAWGCAYHIYADNEAGDYEWFTSEEGFLPPYKTPREKVFKRYYDNRKPGEIYIEEFKGKACKEHYKYLSKLPVVGDALMDMKKAGVAWPTSQIDHVVYFSHGYLLFITYEPVPEAYTIFKRFAREFEQTYARFLDLKKAEAQAKEARIETALERVRARSMAMHESNELLDVIKVVSDQLRLLGFRFHNVSFGQYDQQDKYRYWMSSTDRDMPFYFEVPVVRNPMMDMIIDAWKRGDDFMAGVLTAKQSSRWHRHAMKYDTPYKLGKAAMKNIMTRGYARSVAITPNIFLAIGNYASVPYSEEENSILKRFASVFDQSYVRFLDLQRAEAQAREAHIEAALEKVRSSAMAMHSSEDISLTTTVIFTELRNLGIHSSRCGVGLLSKGSSIARGYAAVTSKSGEMATLNLHIDMNSHPVLKEQYRAWENQEMIIQELKGAKRLSYYKLPFFKTSPNYKPPKRSSAEWGYYIPFADGMFYSWNDTKYSDAELEILRRFKTNIALTFRRFMDLQRAEAQSREAQIEAALERVRARSMAMHDSNELLDVIKVISEQLVQLGVRFGNVSFGANSIEDNYDFWVAARGIDQPYRLHVPNIDNRMYTNIREAQRKKLTFFQDTVSKYESRQWHEHCLKFIKFPLPERMMDIIFNNGYARSTVIMPSIMLIMGNYESKPYSDADNEILKRFAAVFEQSYTRFLDLKKAEHGAQEARIEAALERIRSRSLAMHKSEELQEVIQVVFEKLKELEVQMDTASIVVPHEDDALDFWIANEEHSYTAPVRIPKSAALVNTKIGREALEAFQERPEFRSQLYNKKDSADFWNHAFDYTGFAAISKERKEFLSQINQMLISISYGRNIYIQFNDFTHNSLPEHDASILKRITKVFDQAYTRFTDLKKVEAQSVEANKQASLERIRGEVASMRSKDDLLRITPLIWKELTALGITFIRCGVFIMDDRREEINVFLTTPDGEAINSMVLPFSSPGHVGKILHGWRVQKSYVEHWGYKDFKEFAELLVEQHVIESVGQYLNSIPKAGFVLHCLPFKQGMLYVGNTERLGADQLELIQRVANVFATAYARYEDFSRLENAKEQIEKALVDLRQAQQLLVQSEKMASLGELTAGIAHEIQNPLNFVNNFSDVSNELLDEMKEAIEKGDLEEATTLALDVKQNLEKILHHGKRADGIVKGMLQHSRGATGQKESIDINELCDEYLRLAFHGYRAKDKAFNAKFETEFDKSVPNLSVVPQDIGRVILNLINNAFYAVNVKAQDHSAGDYQPQVTVTTKNLGNQVEIKVSDNGGGIPESAREKIFQPFFTTKPTGQGTGLGLSLSYDIVKAHGGDIRVETNENMGTEFIIHLPL